MFFFSNLKNHDWFLYWWCNSLWQNTYTTSCHDLLNLTYLCENKRYEKTIIQAADACIVFISSNACEKEKHSDPTSTVDFSKIIYYPDKHIFLEFNIIPEQGTAPYAINWLIPDSLVGFGPHKLMITNDLLLHYSIIDADNKMQTFSFNILTDTIDSLKYDYRNQYVGLYKCDVLHTSQTSSDSYIDTLTISKTASFNSIAIQTMFDVRLGNQGNVMTYFNSNGYYTSPEGSFYGYHSGAMITYDSIHYSQSGPLGNYYTNTYKGFRILILNI